jgi:cysteine desulfurase
MLPYLTEQHGDPGRLHQEGRATRVAIEQAREHVASLFGARPREVVFTSSGTEAVNTAVWGALAHSPGADVVTTAVEHSSVLDAIGRSPVEATVVGVDARGRFDPDQIVDALGPQSALVSVQLANHEVGTLQPIEPVIAACRERNVVVHVDACMANGHVPIDFAAMEADACSISAHKFGGPKGVGALLVRRGLRIEPFIVGGAQERARRGGLEAVSEIVGFGAAAAALEGDGLEREADEARRLTDAIAGAALAVDGVARFGDTEGRVPHLVCLGVDGVEAEPILLALDQRGVAVHSGSACSSETLEPSPVLEAMGVDADRSLRVSVGWSTTDADVDAFTTAFPEVVAALRALRA